jgi:hypothetical protein
LLLLVVLLQSFLALLRLPQDYKGGVKSAGRNRNKILRKCGRDGGGGFRV